MDQVIEVLTKADTTKANSVARNADAIATISDQFLAPIAEKIAKAGGPEHEFIGGAAAKTKPQYIAELRLVTPEPNSLNPRLRIALEKRNKKDDTNLEVFDYWSGVTVVQGWTAPDGIEYPANIRWGFWTHAPKAKDRIVPPYRYLARSLEWEPAERLISRPVLNLRSFWLTMFGGIVEASTVLSNEGLAELSDIIAGEMMLITRLMQK